MKDRLVLWGGLECTVNRVRDTFFSQLDRNGHATREDDLQRFASLGIRALRYPVLWERTAPSRIEDADWSWLDARLPMLRALGVEPIAGLLHHGSGPLPGGLLDPNFADRLAQFARAVAERYPWLSYYTPVNEPNTTARFSGLYGVWHPHGTDDRTYLEALINQCKATVYAMREVRSVNPDAKLVQTDDLGKTQGTPAMTELVSFYNERRWLSWDLLCGKVVPGHALWQYIMDAGVAAEDVLWFVDNPCPPDIIGINYYITSERWLDDRIHQYPQAYRCEWYGHRLADIEAARALAHPPPGIRALIDEAWQRYGLPLAVTEAHIDATRQDQLRWLHEIWTAASEARAQGADVRAVTVWALLGSYDWNCLVTEERGYYESGAFDVRGHEPRETAVAALMRDLAAGRPHDHPVLHGTGWWRRPGRFLCEPVVLDALGGASSGLGALAATARSRDETHAPAPILVVGDGALAQLFATLCAQRDLRYVTVSADELLVSDAIDTFEPWAVINAMDPVDADAAERSPRDALQGIAKMAAALAEACAARGIEYLGFSSDCVFDGRAARPYVETDGVGPLNRLGRCMTGMERDVLRCFPEALVIRTGPVFGLWQGVDFLDRALRALADDRTFVAAKDVTVSPTYAPDLVHACLDLLIDRESGIVHLSNRGAVTCFEFAVQAADIAGLDSSLVEACQVEAMRSSAPQPLYRALASRRAAVLPALDDALRRCVEHWRAHVCKTEPGLAMQTRSGA
ncbi:family 1 glycosylhydrolase [Caballeronia sp. LZ062]|uniref:family 1 glycosylhydrolase n=1 Tax=unclassified Caballeronia TaxID=2646786 RepID=UPI00285C618A|nr:MULTISPECIES: family 1 glycosylhydrolase [unclassified Caballeronia]MDR5857677.1 family 1 glycosylhydrolase [Caballeronia sp. LZ050]MDR5869227.1 family 1 glycosylhydrolase [Caballeronia sp. LZ062]